MPMKAIFDSKQLREALQMINIIDSKTLPILSFTPVRCEGGKSTLTNTNLECAIRLSIDCVHDKPFDCFINRKPTEKFLHGANGKATLTIVNDNTILERDNLGKFRMTPNIKRLEDYPPMLTVSNAKWTTIDAKWFLQYLAIAITSCATEVSRPVLNGIVFKDGEMASADGFRLVAIKHAKCNWGLGDKSAIIPLASALIIRKLFAKCSMLEMAWDTERYQVFLKSGNISFVSQLIQGTFPNYTSLIPKTFNCKASFSAPLLAQRLSMIDPKNINSGTVRYIFHKLEDTKEEVCSLSASMDEDMYAYELSLPVKIDADESKIAFNYKYVLDAIKPFSVCDLELTSPSSPGKFTGDVEGLTVVVMPMFVSGW